MASDPIVWRLERVEKRVEHIDQHGTREIAVQKVQLEALKEEVGELHDDVKSLRRALYTVSGSVLVGAIMFTATVLQIT